MCSSARGNGPRSAANARDAPANEGLAPPVGCVARAPADFQSPRDGLRPAHPVDSWALPSITRHRSLTGGITQQPTRRTLSSYSQANLPKGDRDPEKRFDPQALLGTDLQQSPLTLVSWF